LAIHVPSNGKLFLSAPDAINYRLDDGPSRHIDGCRNDDRIASLFFLQLVSWQDDWPEPVQRRIGTGLAITKHDCSGRARKRLRISRRQKLDSFFSACSAMGDAPSE
jgi:hypothetical protein